MPALCVVQTAKILFIFLSALLLLLKRDYVLEVHLLFGLQAGSQQCVRMVKIVLRLRDWSPLWWEISPGRLLSPLEWEIGSRTIVSVAGKPWR